MANKQINELDPKTVLSLTDNFEIQELAGLSKKVSAQKILDLVVANLTIEQTKYVAQNGSDITGTGTLNNPWETLQYAYNQILDAEASKPYRIQVLTGVYSWTTVNIKPYIFVSFNNSQVIISNTVQLDSSWIGITGVFSWEDIFNANLAITCDFTGVTAGVVAKLSNIRSETGNIFAFLGSTTVIPTIFIDNIYGFTPPQIQMTDCLSLIKNSKLGITYVSNFLNNANYEIFSSSLSELSIITNSNDPLAVACNSCKVNGNTSIFCYGSGTISLSLTDTPLIVTPTIDATPGGGVVNLTYDYINTDIAPLGTVNLKPLIHSLVWGKFQTYGQSISTTTVNSGPAVSPFNLAGATSTFTYQQVGVLVNSSAILTNNTGKNGYFRVTSKVCFVAVGFDSDLEFMHVIDSTTIVPSSITQGSAVVPALIGGISEITIESDVFVNSGSTVEIMTRAIDGMVKNIKVISLTHRMNGN